MQLERERLWLAVVQQTAYEADLPLVCSPLCIDLAMNVDEVYSQGWSRVLAEALVGDDVSNCRIQSISCGATSTVVLMDGGEVRSFGWGDRGQLGQGSCLNSPVMRQINRFQFLGSTVHRPMLSRVFIRKVAAGDEHTVLLSEKGEVFSFGSNSWGQLGIAYHTSSSKSFTTSPRLVALNRSTVDVACGSYHTAVLLDGGIILTWGSYDFSRPDPDNLWMPRRVQNCPHVSRSIVCGRHFTAVHAHDGQLWLWGSNQFGQLGVGRALPASRKPIRVCAPASALAAPQGRGQRRRHSQGRVDEQNTNGPSASVADLSPGQRVALGPGGETDDLGKVIKKLTGNHYLVQPDEEGARPVKVLRGNLEPLQFVRARQIAAGAAHCIAITTSGAVLAWGQNRQGQVGARSSRAAIYVPARVSTLPHDSGDEVCSVAAGLRHSVAVTTSCRIFSWGLAGSFRFVSPAAADPVDAYGRFREPVILHDSLTRFPGTLKSPTPVEAVGWPRETPTRPESITVTCSYSRSMSVTVLSADFGGNPLVTAIATKSSRLSIDGQQE